jgi:hypothetical protein
MKQGILKHVQHDNVAEISYSELVASKRPSYYSGELGPIVEPSCHYDSDFYSLVGGIYSKIYFFETAEKEVPRLYRGWGSPRCIGAALKVPQDWGI